MSEHQQNAFKKLSRLKVGALFMSMGTGKTKVALDLIDFKKAKVDYVLWICPFSIKNEILDERNKWHPDIEMEIVGCESIGSSDRIYMEILNKVKDAKKAFVVVDESLKIKNIHAKRTKRIIEIGKHATYKLILNGTPISRNILDLWSQMEFLSPKILDQTYRQFKDRYCEYYVSGKLKGKVRRQHNVPYLISVIKPYIYDCELDLDKDKNHSTEFYSCDLEEYQEYKDEIFEQYYDALMDDINFQALTTKLHRWYCTHSDKSKKIKELCDEIDERVIVFVRYLESIPTGEKRIVGALNEKERRELINGFRNGDFSTLYITYGCGSYGLNLQFCHNVIFADKVWDYALRTQAEARVFRMGQSEEVNYYDMTCVGVGLENLMDRCLYKKSDLLQEIKIEIQKTKGGIKEWVKSI